MAARVVIEDDGEGFPPALCDQSGPAWVAESESGRGLQLVRSLVDELRCTNGHGGGAVVTLTWAELAVISPKRMIVAAARTRRGTADATERLIAHEYERLLRDAQR